MARLIDPDRLARFAAAEAEVREQYRQSPVASDLSITHQFLQMWPVDKRPQGWSFDVEFAVFRIYQAAGALDYYKFDRL